LANIGNPAVETEIGEVQTAGRTLDLEVVTLEIRRADDIAPAFDALKSRADALYACADALVTSNRIRINTLAQGARLPTMYSYREYVEAEGLMSFQPNLDKPRQKTASAMEGTAPIGGQGTAAMPQDSYASLEEKLARAQRELDEAQLQ
jgi:putative ABC transport system substrate-binding protein